MMPDIMAEMLEGAAGWAWGSHTCSGTRPALVPKPKSRSTKAAFLASSGIAPRAPSSRNAAKSKEWSPGVLIHMMMNATVMRAVPRWVMTTYSRPEDTLSRFLFSYMTRRYEDTDMVSHMIRKRMALSADITRTRLSRKVLNISPMVPGLYLPSYSLV